MHDHAAPKFTGAAVGVVRSVRGNRIELEAPAALHPGDGLAYFDERAGCAALR